MATPHSIDAFELLKDWPYARGYLRDTLNPDLIEEHAISLLSRALNIGTVVAFVGSGASVAYGRIGWRDLVDDQWRRVERRYTQLNRKGAKKLQDFPGLKKLYDTICDLKRGDQASVASVVRADRLPIIFQLCEELDKALDQATLFTPIQAQLGSGAAKGQFRKAVEELTRDDRAHAKALIVNAFDDGTLNKLQRMKFGQVTINFSDPDRKTLLSTSGKRATSSIDYKLAFSSGVVTALASSLGKRVGARNLVKRSQEILTDAVTRTFTRSKSMWTGPPSPQAREAVSYLLPEHRFILAALLRAFGNDPNRNDAFADALGNIPRILVAGAPGRNDLIPPDRDPLLILRRTLEISRFLTTNYDLEIERLFRDEGFDYLSPVPNPSNPNGQRTNALGATSRSFVFSPELAGELVTFAVSDHSVAPRLVHLHGRATDRDKLLITEQDYQRLYLSDLANIEHRDIVDDAISLTFRSSPLFFVGLGMSEDDILRPLRQFLIDYKRRGDQIAIALLPGDEDKQDALQNRLSLLLRYGVYSIYFGAACLPTQNGSPRHNEPFWLHKIIRVCKALLVFLDSVLDIVKTNSTTIASGIESVKGNYETAIKEASILHARHTSETNRSLLLSPVIFAPLEIHGKKVRGSIDLEIAVLNAAFQFGSDLNKRLSTLKASRNRQKVVFNKRLVAYADALKISVEGAKGSLTSVTMCARLEDLERRWKTWRKTWYREPQPRDPKFSLNTAETPRVCVRHDLALPLEPNPPRDRFYLGAPSQTLDAFLSSLKVAGESKNWIDGRRIMALISRRGVGRGYLFTALKTETNQSLYVQAVSGGKRLRSDYLSFSFIQLGLSPDMSSVWDGLARDLLFDYECLRRDLAKSELQDRIKPFTETYEMVKENFIRLSRLERLHYLMDKWTEYGSGNYKVLPRRLFLGINGIDLFFDRNGYPKNAQLGRFFEVLISDAFNKVPFDIVLQISETNIPVQFRTSEYQVNAWPHLRKAHAHFRLVNRPDVRRRDLMDVRRRLDAAGMSYSDYSGVGAFRDIVHVLQPAKGSYIAAGYFPRVAMLYAWCAVRKVEGGLAATSFEQEVGSRLSTLERGLIKHPYSKADNTPLLRACDAIIQIAYRCEHGGDWKKQEWDSFCEKATGARLGQSGPFVSGAGEALDPDTLAQHIDRRFMRLYQDLSERRFAFTVLLAALDELIDTRPLAVILNDVNELVDTTCSAALAYQAEGVEEQVLRSVLAAYQRRHDRAHFSVCPPHAGDYINRPQYYEFLLNVMRHLAVIGQPTEAEVISACPEIVNFCSGFFDSGKVVDSLQHRVYVRGIVREALEILVERCLVYRIAGYPIGARDQSVNQENCRYALHRLTLRYIFRYMEGPPVEFSDSDYFTLSQYASQPRYLPRLSAKTYVFLRDLTRALSFYPQSRAGTERHEALDSPGGLALASSMLRAAYGITRSVMSVPVVSRLDAMRLKELPDQQSSGFFEDHRLLVRWLLKIAARLEDEFLAVKRTPGYVGPPRPLYAEELAWLYNECGVLSLMQGKLHDATLLLKKADDVIRAPSGLSAPGRGAANVDEEIFRGFRIEPKTGGGALWARVNLNRAIVQIERGRLQQARSTLERIEAIQDEHPSIRFTALGYLGLIAHLGGDRVTARKRYELAFTELIAADRVRAASIFKRHHGDLLRMESKISDSVDYLRLAVDLAGEGGHEDLVQLSRLSLVRSYLASAQSPPVSDVMKQIDEIESYGRVTGMSRLVCEVFMVRSGLLLKQGETRLAGKLATQALELASEHGMQLRKISALNMLARTYIERDQRHMARVMLEASRGMARRAGYQIARESADRLLRQSD